jgi:hypothetical protein
MTVLDIILINEMVKGPVTVNSDFLTDIVDISFKEAESSIQINYTNGSGDVDMEILLQASNDAINFSDVLSSSQQIVEDSGTHIIDIFGTGVSYLRVSIIVTSGSIDLQSCVWKGKRRH